MEAPGIRHAAKCRRTNMPVPEVVVREPVGRDVEISSQASPSIAPETPDDDNIFLMLIYLKKKNLRREQRGSMMESWTMLRRK